MVQSSERQGIEATAVVGLAARTAFADRNGWKKEGNLLAYSLSDADGNAHFVAMEMHRIVRDISSDKNAFERGVEIISDDAGIRVRISPTDLEAVQRQQVGAART